MDDELPPEPEAPRLSGCALLLAIGIGVLLAVGAMVWVIVQEGIGLRH